MKQQQLALDKSHELHRQIVDAATRHPRQARHALAVANRELAERRLTFGHVKPLEAALTALLLSKDDVQFLARTAEALHAAIEKALEYATAAPDRLERFFPEHRRVFPFLARTAGWQAWQVVARYDMAVTEEGRLKLLELNTSCPGGLLISEAMSDVTRHGLAEIDDSIGQTLASWPENATVPADVLADELLALEDAAGVTPDTIGVLKDENGLSFELDLLADSLRRHNRQVVIANAEELRLQEDRLLYGDQVISLTYNKFRVSTPESPNHCWRDGFAQRYEAFLAAQQNGGVVSVNNLGGIALAEDKSFLAILADPEIRALFSADEQLLLDEHVLWTARLQKGPVILHGQAVDLVPYVRANREQFVIKPANEGRGFGVVVGKYADEKEWAAACLVDPRVPKIVQEFTNSVTLPVVCLPRGSGQPIAPAPLGASAAGGESVVQEMFLTLGLTLVRGRYRGLVSRVSANPVTNVAREGFGQAVFARM